MASERSASDGKVGGEVVSRREVRSRDPNSSSKAEHSRLTFSP